MSQKKWTGKEVQSLKNKKGCLPTTNLVNLKSNTMKKHSTNV